MIKTTLYLPDELHAEIKISAAKQRTSMTELIIKRLSNRLEDVTKNVKDSPAKYGLVKKRGEINSDDYI